uniref:phage Gp37/Gp68 family protein n=1 Tax=Streptosporangium sp. CA-256172 TaxID=3240076 RepID=UPI003F499BE5
MKTTTIEWTDATWNPVRGCTKVSRGCDHCYAEAISTRWSGPASFDTVRLIPDVLDAPLSWREPRMVFVNSMGDLFHDAVPEAFIVEVFARIWWAPNHTFQLLTKRHARMAALMPRIEERLRAIEADLALVDAPTPLIWPLSNLWLGVSVEDQHWADIRIPPLRRTPAAVRFLSVEPLLGPVDLSRHLGVEWMESFEGWGAELLASLAGRVGPDGGLDWVIAGGESGPRARPAHPDWFRTLRDQCEAAGTPFFFKQWGQWSPDLNGRGRLLDVLADGRTTEARTGEVADGAVTMRRASSKRLAGRELDGRTWDAFPATAALPQDQK